jgi:hypothetical protein
LSFFFLLLVRLSQLVVARYDEATWRALHGGSPVMGDVGAVLYRNCVGGMAEGGGADACERGMSSDDSYTVASDLLV